MGPNLQIVLTRDASTYGAAESGSISEAGGRSFFTDFATSTTEALHREPHHQQPTSFSVMGEPITAIAVIIVNIMTCSVPKSTEWSNPRDFRRFLPIAVTCLSEASRFRRKGRMTSSGDARCASVQRESPGALVPRGHLSFGLIFVV